MKLKRVYKKSVKSAAEQIRQRRAVLYEEQEYLMLHLKHGGQEAETQAATHRRLSVVQQNLAELTSKADELGVHYVEFLSAPKEQNWPTKLVEQGVQQGWIKLDGDRLTVKTEDSISDVVYKIRRTPGWYCCHDGRRFRDAVSARNYTETAFEGQKSPDPNNPSGYEQLHSYDCVKEN